MIEAEQLAIALEDEFIQGRISNHNGRKAAALIRSQAAEIERLRKAMVKAHNSRSVWISQTVIREALKGETDGTR